MKTLIINSYRNEPEKKIENYVRLVEKLSQYEVIADKNIEPTFNTSRFDAVVLSGSSAFVSSGDYCENFILFLRKLTIPVLGVCYGHQILVKAFGGVVTKGELVDKLEQIRITAPDPLFAGLGAEFQAVENHYEYVEDTGLGAADFRLLAGSVSCPVEAIRHKRKPLYGLQFHLERSGGIGEKLLANFYNHIVTTKT